VTAIDIKHASTETNCRRVNRHDDNSPGTDVRTFGRWTTVRPKRIGLGKARIKARSRRGGQLFVKEVTRLSRQDQILGTLRRVRIVRGKNPCSTGGGSLGATSEECTKRSEQWRKAKGNNSRVVCGTSIGAMNASVIAAVMAIGPGVAA